MKRAPRSLQHHDLYRQYHGRDSEISDLLGECGIFDAITEHLEEGGRVELRGFGVFSVRAYDGHMGRNPRTGEPVSVPAKAVPFFKLGKELRERLNADDA